MKVRVLKDGRYNNPRHRAQTAKAGNVIEVAGGGYAKSLIEDEFVEAVEDAETEATTSETEAEELAAEATEEETPAETAAPAGETKLEDLPGVDTEIANALQDAGYETVAAVRDASDVELLKVSGIGKKRLEDIRKATAEEEA